MNKMIRYFAIHVATILFVAKVFGYQSLKWHLSYVAIAILFAEQVNYIEHYGLQRKKDENGIYESITKMHSWNYLSGAVLIRL